MTQPRKSPTDRQPRAPRQPAMRARLVKVQVQAVMMMDDGKDLVEVSSEPISIAAKDWADFAPKAFAPETLDAYAGAYLEQLQKVTQ